MKKFKSIKYAAAFLIFVLSFFSLNGCSKKANLPGETQPRLSVNAFRTGYKYISGYLKSPGNTDSLNNTGISAHIMGYVIYENVREGQIVSKGMLLLRLNAPEIKSKYYAAKAGYINAKKTYDRIRRLYAENSVSKQTYDNTLMQYNMAKAGLNEASSYLNYKNIYSPISGVITKKNVSMGDLVGPGQMLLIIQSLNKLEFKTSVNVRYYKKLKAGESVNLNFSSINAAVDGKIISIVRSANPYSHSVLVKIEIPGANKFELMPGMYGVARFRTGRRKALIIPKNAVLRRLGITGVYTASDNGEVFFQPVKKGGVYKKNFVIILNGLNPGMTVLTGGLDKIAPGSFVNPKFDNNIDKINKADK